MTPKQREAIDKLKAASWQKHGQKQELKRLRKNYHNRAYYNRLRESGTNSAETSPAVPGSPTGPTIEEAVANIRRGRRA